MVHRRFDHRQCVQICGGGVDEAERRTDGTILMHVPVDPLFLVIPLIFSLVSLVSLPLHGS